MKLVAKGQSRFAALNTPVNASRSEGLVFFAVFSRSVESLLAMMQVENPSETARKAMLANLVAYSEIFDQVQTEVARLDIALRMMKAKLGEL